MAAHCARSDTALQLAADHHCCVSSQIVALYKASHLFPPEKSFSAHFSVTDIHLIEQSR